MWTVVLKLDGLRVFFSRLLGQDGKRDFFAFLACSRGSKKYTWGRVYASVTFSRCEALDQVIYLDS